LPTATPASTSTPTPMPSATASPLTSSSAFIRAIRLHGSLSRGNNEIDSSVTFLGQSLYGSTMSRPAIATPSGRKV
jgi:hypothetical protein